MQVRHILLAALLTAGCAETQSESERSQPLEEAPAVQLPEDRHAANEYEREMKRVSAEKTPVGPVAQEVDWAEARGFKVVPAKWLPAAQAGKLTAIEVPVLAFDDLKLLGSGLLTHHKNWYVLAVEADGLNMNIRGTRNAFTVPGMEIPEAARKAAENYTLTRTHAIVTVSWRAFNVSYSLDIECAKPLADTRCTEDEFALKTAENLGVVEAK